MGELDKTIRYAGTTLGEHRHICAFFRGPEDEYRVLLPFIKEGLDQGDKAFHVVNPKLNDEHRRRLDSVGIDGTFDPHGMFTLWQTVFDEAH